MSKEDCDYMVNVLMLGDYNCGKTSIMNRFAEDVFTEEYNSNTNVDFRVRKIPLGNQIVRLNIWDTAGKEKDSNLCYTYFRGANGVLLTFDLSNPKSFKNLEKWMEMVEVNCPEKCPVMLIGCKADLKHKVTIEEIKYFVSRNENIIDFYQTSSKTGSNVKEIFIKMLLEILGITQKPSKEDATVEEKTVRRCCVMM